MAGMGGPMPQDDALVSRGMSYGTTTPCNADVSEHEAMAYSRD